MDFYTRPIIGETIEILKTHAGGSQIANGKWQDPQSAISNPYSEIFWGDMRVVSPRTGYKILRRGTYETLGFGQIELPEQSIETQGCRLAFSEALVERLRSAGLWLSDPNDYGPNWARQRDAVRVAMTIAARVAVWRSWPESSTMSITASPSRLCRR